MGRLKKIKDAVTQEETITSEVKDDPIPVEPKIKDDPLLTRKSLFRIDEAASYFGVTDRCIRLWIEHGHLAGEKVVGSIRVSRDSILKCRFR